MSRSVTTVVKADFADQLIYEFNQARTDPLSYAKKVRQFLNYIKVIENQNLFIYEADGEKFPKINLITGEKAFLDFIDYLEQSPRLDKLFLNDEVKIKVPNQVQDMNSYEKISGLITSTKRKLKGYYKGLKFHYDVCFNNAEVSAMLQMIDDTGIGCQRRKNIFAKDMEFVGVSVGRIQSKRVIVYVTLAKAK
jgi:hypothetical protein